MVAPTPSHLLAQPTSVSEKPAPRRRNAVLSVPAKASPSLYRMMTSRSSQAPRLEKYSASGSRTASASVFGALGGVAGSAAAQVAATPTSIRAAISQYA